ncbi:translocation/assembly module TamB domain-containing protein [Chryseobacterium sp. A301]
MANLENKNENENFENKNKSLPEKVGDAAKDAVKDVSDLAKDVVENPAEVVGEFAEQAAKDVTDYKWWAKLLLYVFWIGLGLAALLLIAINLNVTKQWAANQALKVLNQDFKAKMTTQSIEVDYFGDVTIRGLRIEDTRGLEFIKVREFRANSNWIALVTNVGKNNALSFNSLQLTNADIKIITYKGDSISNFIKYVGNFDSGKPSDPLKPPFQLDSRVELVNSKVSIVNQNKPGEEGTWLRATQLNLTAPKVKVNGPNVSAQVNNLNFYTTRYGKTHYIDTFSTQIALTNDFLSLTDLTFNTDHSLLQGDIKLNLNQGSFQDFSTKVRWDVNLKRGSQLSGYDLSYFMTQWDNYKPVNISGKMTGPLNNFHLENFIIGDRDVSIATSTMRLKNLMQGSFEIESNDLSTDFTYVGLKQMLPTFIASKLKNIADDFGRLRYKGAVRVRPEQIFIPNGNLITGIGQAKLQNVFLENYSTELPRYRGYAELNDLNAEAITKMPEVGLISGKINFVGESFDLNRMVVDAKANLSRIEILDKTIHNLVLDGQLNRKTYNGLIRVDDPNAKASVNGKIDFKTSRLLADVIAQIDHLNLNYFTGSKGNQVISGKLDAKLALSNLNDLDLAATAENLRFTNAGKSYFVPNANVKAYFTAGNRVVEVTAPGAVNGRIAGDYQLADLAGMIENGLQKILVGPPPGKQYKGQSFNLEFDVKQGLVNYFAPNLQLPTGATVSGSYQGNSNDLVLNIEASSLKYLLTNKEQIAQLDQVLDTANPALAQADTGEPIKKDSAMVENLVVRINTANLEEQLFANIDRVLYKNNVIRDFTFTGRNEDQKVLHLSTHFLHGSPEMELENDLKSYVINLNQSTTDQGDYLFKFEPTEVKVNTVAWSIDTSPELDHSIVYEKASGNIAIHNLRVYSEQSSLLISQALIKSGKDFQIQGKLDQFQLSKLLEMQANGNDLNIKGLASGTFDIVMNQSVLEPLVDLQIDDIFMNEQDMGNITLNAKKSTQENVFDIEAKVVSAGIIGDNNLHLIGTVNNNTPTPTLDVKMDMKDFDLAFAQQFVKGVFGNLRGNATGVLSISGPINDIDYSGDIALSDFGLKLNFIGVDYSFEDTVIPLSKGQAILNEIQLRDGRNNSSGTISGVIQFETLSSMAVNLIMRADNLMVLNTQQKDFDLFWGRVYGQGNLYVSGPVSGLNIATDLNEPFRALNNSVFTFNAGSTSGVDEFKMLRFLKEDASGAIVLEEKKRSGANMTLDFNIAIDKGTTVNVDLPEDVGNISVRGTANPLRFRMFPNGAISMNGTYLVDSGTFVSQAILERTFQIVKGSSMRWDGNAMTPALDIQANYVRAVTNTGQYLGVSALPPVNVLLSVGLRGTLNDPRVELGLSAPDLSSQLKETLAGKMGNEDEKVIQFGSVLVMNSFNVQNAAGFNLDVGSTLENSGYNMLFKQLGSVFNTISNEVQVDLNYLKGDTGSNTGDRANASVSFALSPRVTVKTGLGVPLSKGSEGAEYNYLSGEGIIEYDWSKKNDGTRLLRAYSKPSNIGLVAGNAGGTGENQTYGVGVVYSKSFNTIFKGKKNKQKRDSLKAIIDSAKIKTAD